MKKLWISPYTLTHGKTGVARHGCLLKMQTPDFPEGYADLFPWVEFGDPDLKQIPKLLKQDFVTSPLLQKSLYFAEKDGRARVEKKSLISNQKIKNHYLVDEINDQTFQDICKALAKGFDRLKLKVGRDWNKESQLLKDLESSLGAAKWRLDCNLKGDNLDWDFLEAYRDQIEFIEDPFPEAGKWSKTWPWAFDQPFLSRDQVSVKWQILKPAKQSFTNLEEEQNIVVTSYMDHPVGIAHCLAETQEKILQRHDFGFMTFSIYKETAFHSYLLSEGPMLWMEAESGIGFTDLLRRQQWVAL